MTNIEEEIQQESKLNGMDFLFNSFQVIRR